MGLKTDENGNIKRGPGRPPGTPNKLGVVVKNAVIEALGTAGDAVGAQYGLSGAHGYMHNLAMNEKQAFAVLAGKILPTQVEGTGEDGKITISWSTS
jgi:hypothetical protein